MVLRLVASRAGQVRRISDSWKMSHAASAGIVLLGRLVGVGWSWRPVCWDDVPPLVAVATRLFADFDIVYDTASVRATELHL